MTFKKTTSDIVGYVVTTLAGMGVFLVVVWKFDVAHVIAGAAFGVAATGFIAVVVHTGR